MHFYCFSVYIRQKVKVKVAQTCPTLCNLMDYTVHVILQARMLEWVAFPSSRGSSEARGWTQVSRIAGDFLYQLSHQGSPVRTGAKTLTYIHSSSGYTVFSSAFLVLFRLIFPFLSTSLFLLHSTLPQARGGVWAPPNSPKTHLNYLRYFYFKSKGKLLFKKIVYSFISLHLVLVVAYGI